MRQKNSEYLAKRRDYTAAALKKECISCAAPVGERALQPECPAAAYSLAEAKKSANPRSSEQQEPAPASPGP